MAKHEITHQIHLFFSENLGILQSPTPVGAIGFLGLLRHHHHPQTEEEGPRTQAQCLESLPSGTSLPTEQGVCDLKGSGQPEPVSLLPDHTQGTLGTGIC